MISETYIILANAPLQIGSEKVKSLLSRGNLVALDGIANVLKEWQLSPNVILGDFDSISPDTKKFFESNKVELVYAPSQDNTDLEKAIAFCDERKARKIEIYNALGGRTDHTLGNMSFLKKCYRKDRPIKLYSEQECLEYLEDIRLTIHGKKGDRLAVLGFSKARITSSGLSYDMKDYLLDLGKSESISNSLALDRTNLLIQGQALLIYSEGSRIVKF